MITRIEIDTEDVIDADGLVIYQLQIPRAVPLPEEEWAADRARHGLVIDKVAIAGERVTCWGTRRP